MTALADQVVRKSLALGGDGDVRLSYAPTVNRQRPWQATTSIKPARHRNRLAWVWGSDPDDALSRLVRVLPA